MERKLLIGFIILAGGSVFLMRKRLMGLTKKSEKKSFEEEFEESAIKEKSKIDLFKEFLFTKLKSGIDLSDENLKYDELSKEFAMPVENIPEYIKVVTEEYQESQKEEQSEPPTRKLSPRTEKDL